MKKSILLNIIFIASLFTCALSSCGSGESSNNTPTTQTPAIVISTTHTTVQKFTVTFDADNGTSNALVEVEVGNRVTKPSDPTKDGYTFDGWYLNETKYDFNSNVESNITLKAHWTEIKYIVSFDADNDSEIVTVEVKWNSKIERPEDPIKDGYEFIGWFMYGETIPFDFDTKITDGIILEAHWKKYEVTFDYDNESYIYTTEVNDIGKIDKPQDPTKNGYIFDGWFFGDEKDPFDFDTIIAENITLKAHWTEIKYKVTFDANNSSNNELVEVKWNNKVTKPEDPKKENYIFDGWFLGNATTPFDFDTIITESITLEAHWSPIYKCEISNNNCVLVKVDASMKSQENIVIPSEANIYGTLYPVTSIGSNVFANFSNLKRITIPSSITTIGDNAFSGCTNLEFISLQNNVTSIGDETFSNCENMSYISITSSITSIGIDAFHNCKNLANIYYNGSIVDWCNISFNNECSNPMCHASYLYMLDDYGNFEYNGQKYDLKNQTNELILPDGVSSIMKYTFLGWNNITSITIPNSVTSIVEGAFNGFSSLESITLPFTGDKRHNSTDTHQYPFGYIFGQDSYIGGTKTLQISYVSYTSDEISIYYYIPASLKEVILTDITYIPLYSFYNCDALENIIIPNDLTIIGAWAFRECDSLTSITIPNGVTSIGEYAFAYCKSLANITIPNTVKKIGNNAFYYCSGLKDITFEDNSQIVCIEDNIFKNCSSLTSIIVPNSVTSIGKGAFSGCSSLESITLPFTGDKRHRSTDEYQYPLGYIFGIDSYTGGIGTTQYYFDSSTNGKTSSYYYIPETLKEIIVTDTTYIPYGTFNNCRSLSSITIPNDVTFIGASAFEDCTSLSNFIMPSSVTSIGEYAFYNCSSLSSITIPNSLEIIDERTFYECTNLANITFEDNSQLKKIDNDAFRYCTNLTNLYYNGSIENWCNISFSNSYSNPMSYASNFYILDDANDKYSLLRKVVLSTNVKTINNYSFYNINTITSIIIPNSVETIGYSAFSGCSSLESITLPFVGGKRYEEDEKTKYPFGYIFGTTNFEGSIATIQEYFEDPLKNVQTSKYYLPDSLKEVILTDTKYIHYCSFINCINITSIVLPNTVISIGEKSFANCSNLASITIPNSITTIGNQAFLDCSKLALVTFAENSKLTSIENYAFKNCNSLINITIPTSLLTMGYGPFSGCSSLESITLPFTGDKRHEATDTYQYPFGFIFGTSSYTGSTGTSQYYYSSSTPGTTYSHYYIPTNLKEVILTDMQYMPYGTLDGCGNISDITILSNVTNIEGCAFRNCTNLTNVYYNGTIEDWCNISFSNLSSNPMYNASNFYLLDDNGNVEHTGFKYSLLKELVIPSTITLIGDCQFYGFNCLTSITLHESMTSIGNYAFSECFNLTNLTIVDSVESIGERSFYNCTGLKDVKIGNGVTSIDEDAFSGCNNLKNISIGNGVTTINNDVFFRCNNLANVYYNGAIENWFNISFSNYESTPMYYASNLYIQDVNGDIEYTGNKYSSLNQTTKLILPDGISTIGRYQLYKFNNLTSITIPNSITSIDNNAFSCCDKLFEIYNLSSIEITTSFGKSLLKVHTSLDEPSILTIDKNNFIFGCISNNDNENTENKYYLLGYLGKNTRLLFPSTFIYNGNEIDHYTIHSNAFKNNINITGIIIPETVENIETDAFYGCRRLVEVINCSSINITTTSYGLDALIIYNAFNDSIVTKDENKYVFAYVKGKGYLIGYDGNDSELTLPSTFTYKNTEVNKYEIRDYAFENCRDLTSIDIPNDVTGIGKNAFYNCINLSSITIPNTVTGINDNAFYNCTNLTNVYYNGTIEDWFNIKFSDFYSNPMYYSSNFYILDDNGDIEYNGNKYSLLTDLVIPETVTTIGNYQLIGIKMTTITIPNNITSIGESAFFKCSSLTNLYYIGTIEDWCNISFSDINSNPMRFASNFYLLNNNGNIEYNGNKYNLLTELVIPDTVTTIGNYQFAGFSFLTKVTIPNNIASIGNAAFSGCSSLESITLPFTGNKRHEFTDTYQYPLGYIFGRYDYTGGIGTQQSYYGPSILETTKDTYYIPAELKEVIITYTTYIPYRTFYNCERLTTIIIPDGIEFIGESTFYNCKNLENLIMPKSITGIGNDAFYNCRNLKNLYYNGTIEDWCNITFSSEASNPKYYASNFYILDNNGDIEYNGNKYSLLTELVIPNTVTSLKNYALVHFNFTHLTIPNSVTSIGTRVFHNCYSLLNVVFEGNSIITSIGDYAFYNCNNLTSIIIPNTVKTLSKGAFSNCSKLTDITIPNSITSIGDFTFSECRSLTSIYYGGKASQYASLSNTPTTGTVYYYSEEEPATEGNYWHYDEDGVTPIIWGNNS